MINLTTHPLDDYIEQQQLNNLDNNSNVSLANQNTVLDDFQATIQ